MFPPAMGVEVEITGIAAGGAGVGRLPDGRVTFVHRTAPGDRAEVRVVETRKRWTRGELVAIRAPSRDRRTAPCPHYDRCGGCTLEHLTYEAQLRAKAGIVTDALRRIGGLQVDGPPIAPSPREFRYRNRVTFVLRRGPEGITAGFHALERPGEIVDLGADCLLPEEALAETWALLRREWGPEARRLPSGPELRLTLRASESGSVGLAVDGGYASGRPDELLAAVPALEGIWHRPAGAREYRRLAGAGLRDRWADEEVELGGDVFTQVNRLAAELLEAHVMERLMAARPATVLDGYCGVGLYARRLVREGVRVVGIEAHPAALEEARRAAPGARFLEGRVESLIADALPVDAAVLNPPRAGLEATVPDRLLERPPARLIYVSCDPATLARDLQRLGRGYGVSGIRCFDLFPQTAHVETVVELERVA
ncbi:MAG TPA: TRAM domain-containing protein [Longimicrobiales bacterium]|nr:TRAM domain-containing protein [Longimicrobiales bacterium]